MCPLLAAATSEEAAMVKRRNVNKGRHKRNTRHACNMHFNFITKVTAHKRMDDGKRSEGKRDARTAFTDTSPGEHGACNEAQIYIYID